MEDHGHHSRSQRAKGLQCQRGAAVGWVGFGVIIKSSPCTIGCCSGCPAIDECPWLFKAGLTVSRGLQGTVASDVLSGPHLGKMKILAGARRRVQVWALVPLAAPANWNFAGG